VEFQQLEEDWLRFKNYLHFDNRISEAGQDEIKRLVSESGATFITHPIFDTCLWAAGMGESLFNFATTSAPSSARILSWWVDFPMSANTW
jgi:hypothetical protein